MIDLRGKLDVFIITNGRSTFPYCKKSIEKQKNVKINVTLIENMEWLDANRKILADCKSEFFLRVDDDMLLNSNALNFMWDVVSKESKNVALRSWLLWEPYSDKVCRGIKIYTHSIASKLGFNISKLGKIDKVFAKALVKTSYKRKKHKDILAIHSCSTVQEHIAYAYMRGEQNGPDFKKEKKWMKKSISNCRYDLPQQYDMSDKFLYNLNKKSKTDFYKFCVR